MSITVREAFARKITKLRKEHDLTQEDVAASLGITRARYSSYEERRREPPLAILKEIAKYYACTLDELIDTTSVCQA
jgi:transcriptional regulator with XRE-family HTH domain